MTFGGGLVQRFPQRWYSERESEASGASGMRQVPRPRRKQIRVGPNPYSSHHQQERKRWAGLVAQGGVRCSVCRLFIVPGSLWHLDHLLPVSLGGREISPKHPAHQFCNISKGGRNRRK